MRKFLNKTVLCGAVAVLLTAHPPAQAGADATDDRAAPPDLGAENTASLIRNTPSEQVYVIPAADSDRTVSGSIEIGARATRGDINNAKFREYRDPRDGPAINSFDLSVDH